MHDADQRERGAFDDSVSQTMPGVRMLFEPISHALLCVVICDALTCLACFLYLARRELWIAR